MSDLLFKLLNKCFRPVQIHFHSRSLDINHTLKKDKICLTVRGKKNKTTHKVNVFLLFFLTLSNTSQLLTAPNTGLWLPASFPRMLSLRRHSSSVCVSSTGQARIRARSCSSDSELWTPSEQSCSWASASLQLETMEAFMQRCWLWQSDSAQQSHGRDNGGDWMGVWKKVCRNQSISMPELGFLYKKVCNHPAFKINQLPLNLI